MRFFVGRPEPMVISSSVESTIVAIATPAGYGGIGIVRLSGPRAHELAKALLPDDVAPLEPNAVRLARLVNPETRLTIDEALVTWFKAPRSFTGEDAVAIRHAYANGATIVERWAAEHGLSWAAPGG